MKKVKVKGPKLYTRMQAERALSAGIDPATFFDVENPLAKRDPKNPNAKINNHPNYHTRRKAFYLLGCPLPEKEDDRNKLLADLKLVMVDGVVMTKGAAEKKAAQEVQPEPELEVNFIKTGEENEIPFELVKAENNEEQS